MTESSRKLKNGVKSKVGLALSETRHALGLKLKDIAKETGLSFAKADSSDNRQFNSRRIPVYAEIKPQYAYF